MIDHTVLKADATKAMVTKIIDEAKYNFASVCDVIKYSVNLLRSSLADSDVKSMYCDWISF